MEGPAFFFFFAWPSSEDFESEEFRRFCAVCYRVRAFKPTLTVNGLHAVLSVAARSPEAVTYEDFAISTGQRYNSAAIQAGQLSDGRGKLVGLRLLKRVPGADRKQKLLTLSRTGTAIKQLFHTVSQDPDRDCAEFFSSTILPVFEIVRKEAPNIALGTFCVLLAVVQNIQNFGAHGAPSRLIAVQLGISNLSKHFENLSTGSKKKPGFELIELLPHSQDGRIMLPNLTKKGLTLAANISSALLLKPPDPVRFPKEERLQAAPSADDVKMFSANDFNLEKIVWLQPDGARLTPSGEGGGA